MKLESSTKLKSTDWKQTKGIFQNKNSVMVFCEREKNIFSPKEISGKFFFLVLRAFLLFFDSAKDDEKILFQNLKGFRKTLSQKEAKKVSPKVSNQN